VAGEGQNGLLRRFTAWGIKNKANHAQAPIYLSKVPVGLCDADQVKLAMDAIKAIADQHGEPALIVIDTVARNFGPGDENSTADMSRFINAADRIRSMYQSAVHLVHHTGHADKTRARGAMALKGALDAEYQVAKDANGIVTVKATKMTDAAMPDPMAFKIRGVDLPINDEDGNPITSAVLGHLPGSQAAKKPSPKAGKGKNQTYCLKILAQLRSARRRTVTPFEDPDMVPVGGWRDACINRDFDRRQWRDAKKSLVRQGVISIEEGDVIDHRDVFILKFGPKLKAPF